MNRQPRPSRWFIAAVVATAVVYLVSGGGRAWSDYASERAQVAGDTGLRAASAATATDDFFDDRLDLLRTVALSPTVRGADPTGLQAYFVEVQQGNPAFYQLLLLDPQGGIRAAVPAGPADTAGLAGRDAAGVVVATGQPFVSDADFSRTDRRPGVILAVPTLDPDGALTGVLVGVVSLEQLERSLADYRRGRTGVVLVVDRAGQLAIGGAPGSVTNVSASPLLTRARADGSGVVSDTTGVRGDADRLVAFHDVPTGNWLIFLEQSEQEVLGPAQRTLLLLLLGMAAVALAGVVGATWAGKRLDRLAQGQAQALRESEALRAIAHLLGSNLAMDQTLRLIAEQARELFGADFTAVATIERGQGAPVWRAVVGGHSRIWEDPSVAPSGIGQRVSRQRQPIVVASFDPDGPTAGDFPIHLAEALRTSLTVPLFHDEVVIGALTLAWRTERRVRKEGIQLAEALASSAAVALTNARLYAEAREAVLVRDRFLAAASHELRTPLAHIKGFVSTLRQTDVHWTEEELQDFLTEIERETDRLGRMIGDLLDISAIESGGLAHAERTAVAPHALVQAGADRVRGILGDRSLRVAVPADLSPVYVNRPQMERVLANLLENAAKYSPPTGTIEVSARRIDGEVELRVADDGDGVPAEDRERVFERFFRADTVQAAGIPGTGLGLAICRGIVQAHGGRIWVEDRPGGGAVFVVWVPVAWSAGGEP